MVPARCATDEPEGGGGPRIGAPAWLARTRTEWARMLLRRAGPGDHSRAQEMLTQALTTAGELSLGLVEKHARAFIDHRH